MNIYQVISIFSTVILTSVAVIIGIQIILILKEIRHILTRASMVVDTTESAVRSVVKPVSGFILAIEGLKESSRFAEAFANFIKRHSSPPPPIDLDNSNHPLPPDLI